jgi:hypothetical protein
MTEVLYEQIVHITEEYLGPAAKRFINRQIEFHLEKKPAEVTTQDVPKLAEWGKVSLGLLTEDKAMVDAFEHKIMELVPAGQKA